MQSVFLGILSCHYQRYDAHHAQVLLPVARAQPRARGSTISCMASTSAPQASWSAAGTCPMAPTGGQFSHDTFDYAPFQAPNYQVAIIDRHAGQSTDRAMHACVRLESYIADY